MIDERTPRAWRSRGWVWPMLAGLALAAASPAMAQNIEPWTKGANWANVRFGYAKSTAEGAADGNVGVGFAYTSFMNSKWAYGASVQVDVLGRYGAASQVEVPWTLELARHFQWTTATRPYVQMGAGAYYTKIQGTTDDGAGFNPGGYLSVGTNTPVSPRGLLGFDMRMSLVGMDHQGNPVFGGEATTGRHQTRSYHWSVKLNYAWVL